MLDADTYGAKEAYYKPIGTEKYPEDEYIFVWDDAFAKLESDCEPTDEQVKLIAEKLGELE